MTLRDRVVRLALHAFGRLPRPVRRSLVRMGTPSYYVGAMAAVVADGHVLLVRQSYRKGWGLPGGLLARGEAPEAAVVREIHEEAGLPVVVEGRAQVVVEPHLRRVDVCFRCAPAPGVDRHTAHATSPEIVEARWVALDALADLQPEAARGLQELGLEVPAGALLSRRPRRTRP